MELCLYTDSVPALSFEDALDFAVGIGAESVEIAAGGQSPAPHMRVFELLDDRSKLEAFASGIHARGLRLAAINCSAWPMHPIYGEQQVQIMRSAIRLAEELGVTKIVTMSGCPGDSAGSRMFNWITYPWPPEARAVVDEQWRSAVRLWQELSDFALGHGIERIALELHPLHLVYNVPTLLKLREEIGPVIGANVDPSHMFWQLVDPVRAVRALGPAIYHVHLKDVEFRESQLAVAGVLDSAAFDTPTERAWLFRTVGRGHGAPFWARFFEALRDVGYRDVLSIENEDPLQPAEDGVREAATFAQSILDALPSTAIGGSLYPGQGTFPPS